MSYSVSISLPTVGRFAVSVASSATVHDLFVAVAQRLGVEPGEIELHRGETALSVTVTMESALTAAVPKPDETTLWLYPRFGSVDHPDATAHLDLDSLKAIVSAL
ncbi:uncharacterized protein AMSG_11074 [Thecamonas trahens ATCC 50062]|uniref:Ubiquitin-like domain-containing protein n=1 Tax=Thecamonas trahens ATCC 50062 TaxID=461836 RepID=A0A0L0DV50_THETB|nr:hypothetical protein AMSG_11074 [Thecamonas trahens ATCC 50062]KNC55413.1 hypothetical protein AMSG_11074 [Thecamonas trahens ATCC 50062]|eukprot:XP_013752952.1 hypothetical protein AMSG_11074 [Thecamonas trahens ATCC 50062]